MEKPKLEQLQDQSEKLHSRIMATTHVPTRKQLQTERAKILGQINILTDKKHRIEQAQYAKKLNDLISENRDFIFFSVNNARTQIQEDGSVEVTFSPCKHKHKFPIKQLLTNHQVEPNYREGDTLQRWQNMMRRNETYSGSMNCSQCRKDKEKRFNLLRKRNNKPIGRLTWELRKLQ